MQSQAFLGLAQRQQLTLTPQLRQALHLLQCSAQELALEVDQALAANPLLEAMDEPVETDVEPPLPAALPWGAGLPRTVSDNIPEHPDALSLADHLLQQLHTTRVTERDGMLVAALIAELDDRGYLDSDPQALAGQLPEGAAVTEQEWRVALRLLQSFDPPGVAARNLVECLQLQLQARRAEWPPGCHARALRLTQHLDDLAAGRWGRLCTALACDRGQLEEARLVLRSLEPRPARAWATEPAHYVTPDVLLRRASGRWQVLMNPAAERPLRLSPALAASLEGERKAPLLTQLRAARDLLHGLDQRRQTILRVAECVVARQPDFLDKGLAGLRPLAQKEVAQALALHESTISRAVRLKYLDTPWGVMELRRFFGAGVATDTGAEASAGAVQALMRELMAAEPPGHPLSDQQLALALAARGVTIARRTVAKYREAMGMLPASLRRTASTGARVE